MEETWNCGDLKLVPGQSRQQRESSLLATALLRATKEDCYRHYGKGVRSIDSNGESECVSTETKSKHNGEMKDDDSKFTSPRRSKLSERFRKIPLEKPESMNSLTCSVCGKRYRSLRSLNNHMVKHKSGQNKSYPENLENGRWKCTCHRCEFQSAYEGVVKRHMSRVHYLKTAQARINSNYQLRKRELSKPQLSPTTSKSKTPKQSRAQAPVTRSNSSRKCKNNSATSTRTINIAGTIVFFLPGFKVRVSETDRALAEVQLAKLNRRKKQSTTKRDIIKSRLNNDRKPRNTAKATFRKPKMMTRSHRVSLRNAANIRRKRKMAKIGKKVKRQPLRKKKKPRDGDGIIQTTSGVNCSAPSCPSPDASELEANMTAENGDTSINGTDQLVTSCNLSNAGLLEKPKKDVTTTLTNNTSQLEKASSHHTNENDLAEQMHQLVLSYGENQNKERSNSPNKPMKSKAAQKEYSWPDTTNASLASVPDSDILESTGVSRDQIYTKPDAAIQCNLDDIVFLSDGKCKVETMDKVNESEDIQVLCDFGGKQSFQRSNASTIVSVKLETAEHDKHIILPSIQEKASAKYSCKICKETFSTEKMKLFHVLHHRKYMQKLIDQDEHEQLSDSNERSTRPTEKEFDVDNILVQSLAAAGITSAHEADVQNNYARAEKSQNTGCDLESTFTENISSSTVSSSQHEEQQNMECVARKKNDDKAAACDTTQSLDAVAITCEKDNGALQSKGSIPEEKNSETISSTTESTSCREEFMAVEHADVNEAITTSNLEDTDATDIVSPNGENSLPETNSTPSSSTSQQEEDANEVDIEDPLYLDTILGMPFAQHDGKSPLTVLKCRICGMKFRKHQSRLLHITQSHPDIINPSRNKVDDLFEEANKTKIVRVSLPGQGGFREVPTYACIYCKRVTADEREYSVHYMTHTNKISPFTCPNCRRSFYRYTALMSHLEKRHPAVAYFSEEEEKKDTVENPPIDVKVKYE